ncbi:methyl-accepting chemotaxis protein [Geothermobacter hydrogeniphilus]|uniref:Methyl-accepting chemotaxis protein n=1 Tax=Geothermobacter hydrogeniphilus TaxID=1969733 RepID=A0A2K2HE01_9BACT|nr:HAMP domain-containing methyl-accepting chemotaxis protein [Geothermobacter hydrogeniphilus]PNU21506.1 methyl-accepting chemotaxis protein [Geothermobacter hydrogeniphilus]
MLKNIKLQYKLVFLFLVMAMLVAVTGSFGLWSQSQIRALLAQTKSRAAQTKITVLMKVALQGSRLNLLEAAMTRGNADDFENHKVDYDLQRGTFDSYCTILLKGQPRLHIPPAQPGSALHKRVENVRRNFEAFDLVAQKLLKRKAALLNGATADGTLDRLVRTELPHEVDAVSVAVDDLLVEVGKLTALGATEAAAIQHRSSVLFLSVIGASILLAVALGLFATRFIVSRIKILVKALRQGAEGDLTATVTILSEDELGRLGADFNLMLEKLSAMLGKVKILTGKLGQMENRMLDVSREVVDGAEVQQRGVEETSAAVIRINDSQQEITAAVEVLNRSVAETALSILNMARNIQGVAGSTESLAGSVEQVSSSISEMVATIKHIEENARTLNHAAVTTASSIAEMDTSIQEIEGNARQTARIAEAVHQDAETGQRAVQATIEGIKEIRRSGQLTADSIHSLDQSVKDIGMFLSVINDVTEEARLLSLNASIIAAQSGEHGRGFAVVADEIRSLAERTGQSTDEIEQVIGRVEEEMRSVIQAVTSAEKKIEEGESLSLQAGTALNKIVDGVERSTVQVSEIARATREQAKGSQLIRDTMEKVSDMVGQIAMSTHQQATASEEIMAEVEKMAELTDRVRNATRKQSDESEQISHLTEGVSSKILEIRQSCDQQAAGSSRIVEAIAAIQESTGKNLGSANAMDTILGELSAEIQALEKEVVAFKVLE